jgi:uncharacterized protein (DUF486 family)
MNATGLMRMQNILASVVTIFGVALFSYFLQVPTPIMTWRGEF